MATPASYPPDQAGTISRLSPDLWVHDRRLALLAEHDAREAAVSRLREERQRRGRREWHVEAHLGEVAWAHRRPVHQRVDLDLEHPLPRRVVAAHLPALECGGERDRSIGRKHGMATLIAGQAARRDETEVGLAPAAVTQAGVIGGGEGPDQTEPRRALQGDGVRR